jgi:hypothetical protein
MKVCTIDHEAVEIPLPALAYLAISHAEYDVLAPIRGYGRELLGPGITVGQDHYSSSLEQVQIDGQTVACIRLTRRENFWIPEDAKPPKDFLFPCDTLRKALTVQVTLAIPSGEA